jgi:hypothetical protein
LNSQVIDHGLDAWNLRGVGCGERARGFAADGAVKGGDLFLDRGLNGFVAEGAVAGDAALDSGGQAGVICGRRGAFASGKAEGNGESAGGQDSV